MICIKALPRWPNGKASASMVADLRSFPAFRLEVFFSLSPTGNLRTGSLMATTGGAWCYRVTAGTGWPSVSML